MNLPDAKQELPEVHIFDIPGYEDKYCATKDGQIWSLKSNKFLKQHNDTYNYLTVSLDNKTVKVHKLIAMTFLDNPNKHPHVDHKNRIRTDNRIENLRYISLSDNQLNKTYSPRNKEYKNIQVKNTTFKVSIKQKNNNIYKSFKTLEEAKEFRDNIFTQRKQQEPQVSL